MKTIKLLIVLTMLSLTMLSLTACKVEVSVGPTSTPVSSSTVVVPTNAATSTALPTKTVDPTATVEAPLLPTPTLVQLPSPTSAPVESTEQNVKIFLIALEDKGRSGTQVGCGDSAVPVTVTIPKTQGVLRAALEKLLSAKQQYYGESGLYNALYQSDLQVAEVMIEQGKAIIRLTGAIRLGGTCDAPRLQAQIEQTALQFSTVTEVAVFVNDVPLKDVLSQK